MPLSSHTSCPIVLYEALPKAHECNQPPKETMPFIKKQDFSNYSAIHDSEVTSIPRDFNVGNSIDNLVTEPRDENLCQCFPSAGPPLCVHHVISLLRFFVQRRN